MRREENRRREEKKQEEREETDVIPFSGCCCFGRMLVLLGCVKFCPRVTVILCSSVLPTGWSASTVTTASASAGWHTPARETRYGKMSLHTNHETIIRRFETKQRFVCTVDASVSSAAHSVTSASLSPPAARETNSPRAVTKLTGPALSISGAVRRLWKSKS